MESDPEYNVKAKAQAKGSASQRNTIGITKIPEFCEISWRSRRSVALPVLGSAPGAPRRSWRSAAFCSAAAFFAALCNASWRFAFALRFLVSRVSVIPLRIPRHSTHSTSLSIFLELGGAPLPPTPLAALRGTPRHYRTLSGIPGGSSALLGARCALWRFEYHWFLGRGSAPCPPQC